MKNIILLLGLTAFFQPSIINAATPHLNTAIEFINVYHPQTATQGNIDMMMAGMFNKKSLPISKRNKISAFLLKKLQSKEYRSGLANIYMGEFNQDELKELIVFYKSSLGKRTLISMPKINSETMRFSDIYFNSISSEFNEILSN